MCIQELIEIDTVVLEMSHHPSIDIYIWKFYNKYP